MRIRKPYLFFILFPVYVLLLFAASAFGEGLPGLFVPADSQNTALLSNSQVPDPIEVRERMGLLNRAAVVEPEALDASESIMMNLFDDVSLIAVRDRTERRSASRLSWFGRIPGDPLSSVTLVVQDGSITGNVVHGSRMFQIRPLSSGIHRVVEVDPSAFPAESEPRIPPQTPADHHIQYVMQADDGSFIDVMVVYTADAVAAAGSVAALESQIQLAIDETNQSYLNSGITQRVQLAHTEQVAYTQSGDIRTDLDRLTDIDGYIDNVHTLRDAHKADLVSLWVNYPGSSCGISWLMTSVSSDFAPYGFSVVNRTCATGYYSFGHEMGHNMGANHDWYVDSSTTPYSYGHGFINTTDRWRSIMAYNDQCASGGFNCTRIQYWSNPDVFYNFDPMGIPDGMPNAADNRKTLNNTAFTVANFRVGCSYSINPPSHSLDLNGGTSSVSVTTATGCGWTASSNNSWIHVTSGSPGTGSGTVGYSVDSYTDTGSRTGTVTIAGQTFTVTQTGCTYSLSPGSQTFDYNGGADSFYVTTQSICPRTATESLDWVTVSGSGAGSGTVSYTVAAYNGVPSRTGNINVGDKTYIVTQTEVPPPVANFSGAPLSGNIVPFQVTFTDLSINAASWSWDFGDGGTSNLQNPAHTFKGTGPYDISLTVTNANGTDTMATTAYVSTAAPCENSPVIRAGNPNTSIQASYDEIADGGADTIDIQAVDITGALAFGKGKTVTLMGGYSCDYLSRIPGTTVIGSITISDAKIAFDSIAIQ